MILGQREDQAAEPESCMHPTLKSKQEMMRYYLSLCFLGNIRLSHGICVTSLLPTRVIRFTRSAEEGFATLLSLTFTNVQTHTANSNESDRATAPRRPAHTMTQASLQLIPYPLNRSAG